MSVCTTSQSQSVRTIAEQALNLMSRADEHTASGEQIAAELRRLPDDDAQILKSRFTRVLLDFWDERAVS